VAVAEDTDGGGGSSPRQNGLINVALIDTTDQVPVAVAANVRGVAVNVLSAALDNRDHRLRGDRWIQRFRLTAPDAASVASGRQAVPLKSGMRPGDRPHSVARVLQVAFEGPVREVDSTCANRAPRTGYPTWGTSVDPRV